MSFSSQSFLCTLTDALAALQPGAGVRAVVFTTEAQHIAAQAYSGPAHALDRLPAPPFVTPLENHYVMSSCDGWSVLQKVMYGHNGRLLGTVSVALDGLAPDAFVAALDGLVAHCAATLDAHGLHDELQHSFNQPFAVCEEGRLLHTMSGPVQTIYDHVLDVMTRTLSLRHCTILELQEGALVAVAHAGVDRDWAETCRIPLEDAFAAQVLATTTARSDSTANMPCLRLPLLEGGVPPREVLCAPLSTRAGTLGFLEVYKAMADPFTDDDLLVVSALAVELAAALENARLHEALGEREDRLRQYAHRLTVAQEEERRRVARDLHDGLGQMLVSSFHYMQAHEYALPTEQPRAAFTHGLSILQECISETRRVMSDLRQSALDDFGLVVTLQRQLDAVAQDVGWHAQFRVDGVIARLAPAIETTIFRVVQEALNNARKHAQTSRVQLNLVQREGEVMVEVQDWGKGFDDVVHAPEATRGQRLGLIGMRERVALLGGSVVVHSIPLQGTTIRITIPTTPIAPVPSNRVEETDLARTMGPEPARLLS